MIIHYINLDDAKARRDTLEANFAATCPTHIPCKLVRFPAISAKDKRVKSLSGSRSDKEKACILSHHDVILKSCQSDEPHWIVEDDVHFCSQSFTAVFDFLDTFKDADWDILFTDIDIRSPSDMIIFFSSLNNIENGHIGNANLSPFYFSSATSYIINPKRREKVSTTLTLPSSSTFIWDLYLSQLINQGKLIAFVTLPFVTGLSSHAIASQIQPAEDRTTDLLFHAFRKLMNVSSDVNDIKKIVDGIADDYFDDRSYCIGKIVSGFMTKHLRIK